MASLDDFFAKRDKKKGKAKKFTTTDEIAKKLEESGKKADKPDKPRKERPKGGPEDQDAGDLDSNSVDEWKEYKEESEKDYSGLKIQKLNINELEEEQEGTQGDRAEGDAPSSKNVWTAAKEGQDENTQPAPTPPSKPDPEPEPQKEEKPQSSENTTSDAAPKSTYVPPHARQKETAAATTPSAARASAVRARPRVAPDINSEEYFPSLSAQASKTS